MSTQVRRIVGGPDRFILANRLFEGSNETQPVIFFKVKNDEDRQEWEEAIKLDGAEREDGSGNNWNLKGHNLANKCKVVIFYSLTNRTGTMTFPAPK